MEEAKSFTLICEAYPNPTIDILNLYIGDFDHSSISVSIYDLNGNLVLKENIMESISSINMSDFAPATYIVKLTSQKEELKVFKVVKR